MRKLNGNNPFCVWWDCKIRTFPTLSRAESFQRSHGGVIGIWSDEEHWWVDTRPTTDLIDGEVSV